MLPKGFVIETVIFLLYQKTAYYFCLVFGSLTIVYEIHLRIPSLQLGHYLLSSQQMTNIDVIK